MADAPLTKEQVQVFDADLSDEQAEAMISTVWARAKKVAPCLKEDAALADEDDEEFVRGILRAVVLRWADSGSGVHTNRVAGDYQEGLNQFGGGLFRPNEILDLQQMCITFSGQRATTIPTGGYDSVLVQHAAWCNVNFSSDAPFPLCDCGAELSWDGTPLWTRD